MSQFGAGWEGKGVGEAVGTLLLDGGRRLMGFAGKRDVSRLVMPMLLPGLLALVAGLPL